MKFKQNEGKADRIIRAIVAVVLAYLAYAKFSGTWQIVTYVVATLSLMTAITGFCGLYEICGINTKK